MRALTECSLHGNPHAFVNKRGEPILLHLLGDRWEHQLVRMYLTFEPRNSFDGLPPIDDAACVRWVEGMIRDAVNIVAISFWEGVIGHAALFPMGELRSEMLLVVAPRFQNCGVGTQLTHCAVHVCDELGMDRIWLSVDVENLRARHVYRKCGFRRVHDESPGGIDMEYDLGGIREALRHPVSSVMNREVVSISMDDTCQTAVSMLTAERIAALPVVGPDRRLLGILCATDLLRPMDCPARIGDVMTRGVVTVHDDTPVGVVIRLFQHRKLRCIPVVDGDGRVVGIVGRKDILVHRETYFADGDSASGEES